MVAIPLLPWLTQAMASLETSPARQVADFHSLFNLALAAIFIALLDPLARLCTKLVTSSAAANAPDKPQYITPASSDAQLALVMQRGRCCGWSISSKDAAHVP